MTEEEFINAIKGNIKEKEYENIQEALERAYDTRKVELDLYWKRATYFWAFIAASFTAYFITAYKDNHHLKFLVLCIGFVFSLAWYLVNRGSGYWLTHWERVIDTIEKQKGSELYRINLQDGNQMLHLDKHYPYSVSRINIVVSLFMCLVWLGLLIGFLLDNYSKRQRDCCCTDWKLVLPLVLTLAISWFLIFRTESGKGEKYFFYKRS